jgi:GT2 family glycosyltransferase
VPAAPVETQPSPAPPWLSREILDALEQKSAADFVLTAYEIILSRGARACDIGGWAAELNTGRIKRTELIVSLFHHAQHEAEWRAAASIADHSYRVPGTGRTLDLKTWRRARASRQRWRDALPVRTHAKFKMRKGKGIKVSVITSLYKGGKYIEAFLDNITSQSIFDRCELIIIDADSPEGEQEVIGRYAARFPQIVNVRLPYRAPIYTAWNVAIKRARGRYLTNANVDDMRRVDSLELQAATLDNLPFVDVVYQDITYSLEPLLSYDQASEIGATSMLRPATRHSIMEHNLPHNAPMWRRRLHNDIGLFDETLQSAADWEFWIRALMADKTFYKLNDPHVVYYANPQGVSTKRLGPALAEGMKVSKRLFRHVLPRAWLEDVSEFRTRCGAVEGIDDTSGILRYREVQSLMRQAAEQWESSGPAAG